jgi:tetratricopeptide (TPR) repeat protein
MAERLGDARLLAYALSARHYALTLPEVAPARRLALLERLVALAERTAAVDVLALGLQESAAELLELGDIARLDVALRRHRGVVESLRQPFFRWVHAFLSQMRAFLAGHLDEADRLAHEALALGQSFGTPNAVPLFGAQLYCVRREQRRLGELASLFERVVEDNPVFPAYRCGLAETYLQLGRRADARALFEQVMARHLEDLARDKDWPAALGVLSPVCVALGDEERAQMLYRLLAPLEGRLITAAHGGVCFGAVSHHRARLAATFGDVEAACSHFEDAVAQLRRASAPLLLAHAQRDWARLLWKSGAPHEREQARALAAEAAAGYASLDLPSRAEEARHLAGPT